MRQFLILFIPLLTPALLYYGGCLALARMKREKVKKLREMPLVPLATAGVLLLAIVLATLGLSGGAPDEAEYTPPRFEGGEIKPSQTIVPNP